MGKFMTKHVDETKEIEAEFIVTDGDGQHLQGQDTAIELGALRIGTQKMHPLQKRIYHSEEIQCLGKHPTNIH